jgi:toxin ParE1/3/4
VIVRFTDEAARNLEALGDYIARENPSRALIFIRDMHITCMNLAELPNRFPLVPRYEKFGIRRRVCGDYLIFYRVEADQVTILHILHGAMDYAALLFPT